MGFHGVGYGPRIVSGRGTLGQLAGGAGALAGSCRRVSLVSDAGLTRLGLVGLAEGVLRSAGFEVTTFADIGGEPNEREVFQGPRWLSLDEVLNNPTIEMVAVETRVERNLGYAEQCVSAG